MIDDVFLALVEVYFVLASKHHNVLLLKSQCFLISV